MSGKKIILQFWLTGLLTLSACTGSLPPHLGQFAPCPDSPNCVSTKATDAEHAIAAIAYDGTLENAKQRLLAILKSLPRTQVVTEKENYLHVEFTSRILRFVDDVEFYLGEEAGKIHFRSASRMGRSDLGVNRKRMQDIRARFSQSGG